MYSLFQINSLQEILGSELRRVALFAGLPSASDCVMNKKHCAYILHACLENTVLLCFLHYEIAISNIKKEIV